MVALDRAALAAIGVGDDVIAERGRIDGERALRFLATLPGLVDRWQQELGLRDARLLPGGVLSAALACRLGDEPVVLKLSGPGATSAQAERAALAAWAGRGACGLRWGTPDGRAILLEAIEPGNAVIPGDEADDLRRACRLLRMLHGVAEIPEVVPDAEAELRWRFERAHRQLDGASPGRDLISHDQVDAAFEVALGLHADRPDTVLCHGDFISKNLLVDAAGSWWAIDPRPCAGDPALDAAFWALTHRPGAGVEQRIAAISRTTGLGAGRLLAWARVFAVSEAALVLDRRTAETHCAWVEESTTREDIS